jgi:hypothetical protein
MTPQEQADERAVCEALARQQIADYERSLAGVDMLPAPLRERGRKAIEKEIAKLKKVLGEV